MLFDIEVRPGPNTGFFQYYTETVEAATSNDAVARVQRANPGCQVRCTRSYNAPQSGGSGSGSSIDGAGAIGLVGLAAAAWAFFTFTPWILMILGGAAATWIGEKVTGQSVQDYAERSDDAGHSKAAIVLALALFAGGIGFVKGDEIKKGFDAPSDTSTQVQQSK